MTLTYSILFLILATVAFIFAAGTAWWVREKPYWNAGLWAVGMAFFVLYFFFKEITVKAS